MTAKRLILISLASSLAAPASTLRVGPGETYGTIQAAIDAASPGDTIRVGPGIYPESLVLSKAPLGLLGARAGIDARGR